MDREKNQVTNARLVDSLIKQGVLRSPGIVAAFRAVDRSRFVPAAEQRHAYDDIPLPLAIGSTISQPYTVAVMLELLQPQLGDRCCDIGAGSGWTAALLATIVGPVGQVTAVERLPKLRTSAVRTIEELGLANVHYYTGDGSQGWPAEAPYDVIQVAAATPDIPAALKTQLAIDGRCVIPVGRTIQDLVLITKMSDNTLQERRVHGYQFVPLITSQHPHQ